jgi:hypothetical protein
MSSSNALLRKLENTTYKLGVKEVKENLGICELPEGTRLILTVDFPRFCGIQ